MEAMKKSVRWNGFIYLKEIAVPNTYDFRSSSKQKEDIWMEYERFLPFHLASQITEHFKASKS